MIGALAFLMVAQAAGPQGLDFGVRARTCDGVVGVAGVVNSGDRPLVVEAVRVEGAPFALAPDLEVPAVLPPGKRWPIGLRAEAPSEGAFDGQLVIETSRGLIFTRLSGAHADVVEDDFRQLARRQVDLLLAIDAAPSMAASRDVRLRNLEALARYVVAQGLDGRIAVTALSGREAGRLRVAPDGRRFVDSRAPDAVARVVALADLPSSPRADRRGFDAVLRAVEAGQAQDFLRPASVLSVVLIADADDRSAISTPAFTHALQRVRGFRFPFALSFSSIVGDPRGGCTGPGGHASASPRYAQVADETGGVFHSFCRADWARALEDGGFAIAAPRRRYFSFGFKSRFFLRARPASTLEVFVDGASIPEVSPSGTINWTYDDKSGSLNFSPFATPEPDAEIRVRYRPGCPVARPR